MNLLIGKSYEVGSQPPEGYLAWHEWAWVQSKKGKLKQCECAKCGLWKFPQELSSETVTTEAKDRRGRAVVIVSKVCNKCHGAAMNNREAFEAWFNETYFEHNLNRDEQGDYISTTPRLIWQAWQAALASQAQQTCKGKFFNQYSDGSIHTFCTSDEAFNHSINNTLEPEKVCFPVSELQSQAQQPIEAKPYGYVTTLRNGTKHFYESLPYLDNAVKCDTVYLQLQAQQEPNKDVHEAIILLSAVFDAWENGTDCYDDFDGVSGSFIGKAFNLDDEIFTRCCDLLNRVNPPRNASQAQQTESQWISVDEQLPEGYKPVLVATNFGDVYTCRLPVIIAKNSKEESSVGKRERFTHWMPLPPAPEGDKP